MEDSDEYFRDPNAARYPKHPLEPSVRVFLAESEDLVTQDIDLFACSSTFGNLLRFVRRVEKPFRFFVEAVGNTVFFMRHENSPKETIHGVRGYGHTFPEAYTTWNGDVKGSVSHQRLLRYRLAGLDCVVRFECDGYLKSKVAQGEQPHGGAREGAKAFGEDELVADLSGIKVDGSMGIASDDSSLKIKRGGHCVPQEAVFDLKTRSARKKDLDVIREELPRFWAAQIPNFILARHEQGLFKEIEVRDIRDDIQAWQRENQDVLKRLRLLLSKIIDVVKAREDGKLEVRCKSVERLELREQESDEHNVLPADVKLRWKEVDEIGTSDGSEHKRLKSPDRRSWSNGSGSDDEEYFPSDSDEEALKDFTACSADSCGYCGHCSY